MPDDMEESEESEDADDEVTVIFSAGRWIFSLRLESSSFFLGEDFYGLFGCL